jgi:transcription elongation factor GreA
VSAAKLSSPAATLTAEGAERLRAELAELIDVRRPEVVARIRSAKELGDLKENADYHAAREEQSFLEGRIQALQAKLRDAVIAIPPSAGQGADLGSSVTVEADGLTVTYTLVGSGLGAVAGRTSPDRGDARGGGDRRDAARVGAVSGPRGRVGRGPGRPRG